MTLDPLKNTLTMLKSFFSAAFALKLLDVSNSIRLCLFALKQPKINDFLKDNGIFQRVLKGFVATPKTINPLTASF